MGSHHGLVTERSVCSLPATDPGCNGMLRLCVAVGVELCLWQSVCGSVSWCSRHRCCYVDQGLKLKLHDLVLRSRADDLCFASLSGVSWEDLQLRLAVLQLLNARLTSVLFMFDVRSTATWNTGYKLRSLGHCIFFDIKMKLLSDALQRTREKKVTLPEVTLDNFKQTMSEDRRLVSPEDSECIFVQAFRQLASKSPAGFRNVRNEPDRVFKIKFIGEQGIDAGGVYREGLSRIVETLLSRHFNLMIPCPNAEHKTGDNLDAFVPNPKHKTPLAIHMFVFVGRLMGMSLRWKATLDFEFPSLVWKLLLGQRPDPSDLRTMDQLAAQALYAIRHCDKDISMSGDEQVPILTQEDFEEVFPDQFFVTNGCNGDEVVLVPGGASKRVTFDNRKEYYDLAMAYRLSEFDAQVAAMRRGMADVVPLQALGLFTWQEVQTLVAGAPIIDVEVLRRNTTYDGYSESDPVIKRFWKVMSSLGDAERAQYVRFAWGRSRLPAVAARWSHKHTLVRCSGDDTALPSSHTCFFSVELPRYSSEEAMMRALRIVCHYGGAGVLFG